MSEQRESDHMAYRTHDGSKWVAWREGRDKFLHARNFDKVGAHSDKIINYLTLKNADTMRWTAEWRGNKFLHYPEGRPAESHEDNIIIYLGWQDPPKVEVWQAEWNAKKALFLHKRLWPNNALATVIKWEDETAMLRAIV